MRMLGQFLQVANSVARKNGTKKYTQTSTNLFTQRFHLSCLSKNRIIYPEFVKIVEVGPRDGLQNEKTIVPSQTKIEFINRLSQTGIKHIEATSFVSKKWVPQMGDCQEVAKGITRAPGVVYSCLTPNKKGLDQAVAVGMDEVAIFCSASEAFSQKNINCSIEESFGRFEQVLEGARALDLPVRGYISCVLGCPYQGPVDPEIVGQTAARLLELGCHEISLGDTIGIGTPGSTYNMLRNVKKYVPEENLAVHFHDSYGQALANILIALQEQISTIDSSVAGLGGCPYANGASGNVATEDVVYMLHGMGIETGINLERLVETAAFISSSINKTPNSKVSIAMLSKFK